jgi:phospholipid/cholesterol/gamma-HCH transport system ATP-binding protein
MDGDIDTIVEVDALGVRYGRQDILQGVSFAIRRGECLGLVGPSGSGKSALLRHVLALERTAGGRLALFGRTIDGPDDAALHTLRRRIGILFQGGALFSALDVLENVTLPLRAMRIPAPWANTMGRFALRRAGLDPKVGAQKPSELSGGMTTRAALARAIVLGPELLVLDEPTQGLDPPVGRAFVAVLEELRRRTPLTVLLVTHDLEILRALADRIAVLGDGRLLVVGAPEEVTRYDHPVVRDYFAEWTHLP